MYNDLSQGQQEPQSGQQPYAQQPPPYAQPQYGQQQYGQPQYGYGQAQLQYVSVGPRAAAIIIDSFIQALLWIILISFIPRLFPHNAQNASGWLAFLTIILFLGYFIVMEAMWGATLGKMLVRLRVVKTDGSPISWSESVIRNLLRIIDGLFYYLVGAILIWDSPLRQRLGDRAAKTVVVRRSSLHAPLGGSGISTLTGLLTSNYLLKQRYCILEQIGKGGMGAVYRAEDTLFHNRLVAVKEMSQSGLNQQEGAEAMDAFKREAHMLANLDHQNLPKIYDYFNDIGRWYLVMDFIAGETLEDYLNKKGGEFPIQEVLDIAMQLCTVLDYLHTRQPAIIFRDLKPSNVMRTATGEIYLIDFGIARLVKHGHTKDTVAYGSIGYAAPEQFGKLTTPQSDIYSLGALLHQMLSGHDPSTNTPDPFTFPPLPKVSTELERLIGQMVQMNAINRPVSMAIVKQELQRIASPAPPIAPKQSPPPQKISPKQSISPPMPKQPVAQPVTPPVAHPPQAPAAKQQATQQQRQIFQRQRLPLILFAVLLVLTIPVGIIVSLVNTSHGISTVHTTSAPTKPPVSSTTVAEPTATVAEPTATVAEPTATVTPPSLPISIFINTRSLNDPNSGVTWGRNQEWIFDPIYIPKTGSYHLTLEYEHLTNTTCDITVDGGEKQKVNLPEAVPFAGSNPYPGNVTIIVKLNKGNNDITVYPPPDLQYWNELWLNSITISQ